MSAIFGRDRATGAGARSAAEDVDAVHEKAEDSTEDGDDVAENGVPIKSGDIEEISCYRITKKSTSIVKLPKIALTGVESQPVQQLANF